MRPPADWEPPYPAFMAAFDDDVERVVMAYYGATGPERDREGFVQWIEAVRGIEDGPVVTNRARFRDKYGDINDVFVLYWLDFGAFRRWDASGPVAGWWQHADRLKGDGGVWRELWQPPASYFETLISSDQPIGIAEARREIVGPVREHAYWGAARDRIRASVTDRLEPETSALEPLTAPPAGHGQRLRVTLPGNVCLIRSGQNWTDCGPEELDLYLEDVHPVLIRGMDYLRDNPVETGCLSCRFLEQTALDGSAEKWSFGLAAFLSLGHLERWAASHPTHLAIFKSFHELVQRRNFMIDLKLWHEIAVMPAGTAMAEYLNCPPQTGFLPFIPASEF